VQTIFRAATTEEVITTYPFTGSYGLKADKTKAKARRPYTDEEAAKVLAAARRETGALRWLPWLLAYTGARPGEVAQLRKEDVRKERGIPFAKITSDADEAGHEVKSNASLRDVPLHRAVIAEGFLEFVEKAKDGPLFRDLSPGRYGKRGDAASDKYMHWLRNVVGIEDKRVVGHSWRHRVEDELREIEAPAEVAHAITGRTLTGSRAGYGLGVSMRKKAKSIERLPIISVSPRAKTKAA
jgi:integrase